MIAKKKMRLESYNMIEVNIYDDNIVKIQPREESNVDKSKYCKLLCTC
jgi:hypothetical protein